MSQAEMDKAAEEAEKDLRENFPEDVQRQIAEWWNRHFMSAGHKRLGRVLVKIGREHSDG